MATQGTMAELTKETDKLLKKLNNREFEYVTLVNDPSHVPPERVEEDYMLSFDRSLSEETIDEFIEPFVKHENYNVHRNQSDSVESIVRITYFPV